MQKNYWQLYSGFSSYVYSCLVLLLFFVTGCEEPAISKIQSNTVIQSVTKEETQDLSKTENAAKPDKYIKTSSSDNDLTEKPVSGSLDQSSEREESSENMSDRTPAHFFSA